MHSDERIRYLANELGIDYGSSSSSADQMRKIAETIGMKDFNSISDVDKLEQTLREQVYQKRAATMPDQESEPNKEIKGKDTISGLWKKMPLKVKLIIIGACISFAFTIIFIVLMIAPLMSLGIIDIERIGTGIGSSSPGFSIVENNLKFWWPIGSEEVTTSGTTLFALGTPEKTVITSPFGTRNDPFTGERKTHNGVDIANYGGKYGEVNIIASKDGKVLYPTNSDPISCPSNGKLDPCGGGYGNYVMIKHNDGTITLYAHLYENSITVREGDTVKQGQVIGKMGSSGRSTGSHLHYEIRVNGVRVNPENYVSSDNPRPSYNPNNYISGSSNKESVCLTLKANGVSNNGVAAIMTNMEHESSFNPTIIGDSGTSYGLCQWHDSRYVNLKSSFPNTYQTIGSQIEFLMYELDNGYSSLHSSLLDGTKSASDLTYDFCVNFERPADTKITCQDRTNSTNSYLNYVNNGCK